MDRLNDQEFLFQELSPGRKMQKLYSMADGIEIVIPRYMVMSAISKRLPDGRFAFTAHPHNCHCARQCTSDMWAPMFTDGEVRCFLAAASTERDSGLLESAGLAHLSPCKAEHLRSNYSKRLHAQNRHRQSWAILQDFLQTQERAEARAEQREQASAMIQLAQGVSGGVGKK